MAAGSLNAAMLSEFCETCASRLVGMCAALEPHELERLAAGARLVHFRPDQTLFYEGDDTDAIFNVTNGVVRLSKMLPDGRRQITGFLFPGDFLGLAFEDTYSYSAEAVGPVCACRYERSTFDQLLDESRTLEHRLLTMTQHELAAAQERMLLLGRKTAPEKVATFLLMLAKRFERDAFHLPMTRAEIADYLGLTLETVSRTLSSLKKQSIISLDTAQSVAIVNRQVLEEVAAA